MEFYLFNFFLCVYQKGKQNQWPCLVWDLQNMELYNKLKHIGFVVFEVYGWWIVLKCNFGCNGFKQGHQTLTVTYRIKIWNCIHQTFADSYRSQFHPTSLSEIRLTWLPHGLIPSFDSSYIWCSVHMPDY